MSTITRDTRQTIIAAAAELFRKQGYGATSMQAVAEAAGISKGNLTYHFPSKQVLFEEVHAQAASYVMRGILLKAFETSPDALSGLEAFTQRVRRWFIDDAGHFVGCLFTNIANETQHSDAAIAHLARRTLSEFKQELADQLAAGQARGEVRADETATALSQAFFWMYEGSLILSRALDDPAEYDAFRAYLRPWLRP